MTRPPRFTVRAPAIFSVSGATVPAVGVTPPVVDPGVVIVTGSAALAVGGPLQWAVWPVKRVADVRAGR